MTSILYLIWFELGQNWNVKVLQIKIFGWMDQGHQSWSTATLLLKHVGLTPVLDLAVHLVNFFGWMSQKGHSSCLKVMGWGGGPCDFSVSPSPFGIDFGTLDFGTSDLGLTIVKVAQNDPLDSSGQKN